MKSVILVSLLLLLVYAGTAQEKEQVPFKRFLVSLSLGNIPLPGNATSILPGAEVYITPRFSVFGEAALQTGKKDLDSTAVNKQYFRYKAEFRYYFTGDGSAVKPYIGLQHTGASRSFDVAKTDKYYEKGQDDSVYRYNKAHINSPINTVTVQFGAAIRIWKGLYGDMALGCGFRFIKTSYSDLVNLQKVQNTAFILIRPLSSYRYIGQMTRSQLNLNFRLSYRF